MNDHFYFSHLRDALTKGIAFYANGMPNREAYINSNANLFRGTLLVGCFAYAESKLLQGWIKKYGKAQERELYCLRFVRNAFVHCNSNLNLLSPPWLGKTVDESKGMPADITTYVEAFVADLNNGMITDQKGNVYPPYLNVTHGIAELKEESEHIITNLCIKLFHRRDNAAKKVQIL